MNIKEFFKKKTTIGILIGLVVVIGSCSLFGGDDTTSAEFITVGRQDLVQEVSVTGTVQATQAVDLSFETGGKIADVYAEVGKTVVEGQELAVLVNSTVRAQVAGARASVDSAEGQLLQLNSTLSAQEAQLSELKNGTRQEELNIYATKVSNAEDALADANTALANAQTSADTNLQNLYNDVPDVLQNAYFYADDAVRVKINDLFTNDSSDNAELTFVVADYSSQANSERGRVSAEKALVDFRDEINNLSTEYEDLDAEMNTALEHLYIVRDLLTYTMDAVNDSAGLSPTTIATYQASINSARTNVNTVITAVNTQIQAIASQKNTNASAISTATSSVNTSESSLAVASAEYSLKQAGATSEQITIQEASVEGARANVQIQEARINEALANLDQYLAMLNKTIIYAPFDGIITKQDAKIGEIAGAGINLVSIMSSSKFEMEANVAEADIAKLSIGMEANVTLDAYGSDVAFPAKLVLIDPAETVIDGVSTYKIILQFNEETDQIKSGMTANIDITGEKREQVIAIPQRSIIRKDDEKFVKVLQEDGTTKEVKVGTGFRGSNGYIEILSGLNIGDKIVPYSE
ncbi:MAG: efflux RND transporter periplasmic adaptor subunit [Candidatus Gracilibacteria bacterium]